MSTDNMSINKILILFIVLTCFTGQALATTFSCNKSKQLNNQSISKMDCHEEMKTLHSSLVELSENVNNECEEKCSCCITLCASTSLFLSYFSAQKPIDTLIPYLSRALYASQQTSLYRPPITA